MSNDLVVQLGAKLDQFASDMNQAGDIADNAVSRIESSFASLNPSAGGFGALGLSITAAVGSVGALLTALASVNSELADIQKNSAFSNISTERFQQIQFGAAQKGGISSDQSTTDLANVSKLLADANYNENSLTKILDANNLKYKDRNGDVISLNQLLTVAGTLLGKFDSIPDKTKAAQMVGLSEGWVGALHDGSAAFDAVAKSANDAGVIIDAQTIAKAADFDRAWKASSAQLGAQFKSVTADIAVYLDGLIDKANAYVAAINLSNGTTPGSGQDKFNAIADALDVVRKDSQGAAQDVEQLTRVINNLMASGNVDPDIIAGLQDIRDKANDAADAIKKANEQQSKADFPSGVPTPTARPTAANAPTGGGKLPPRGGDASDAYDRAQESIGKLTARTEAEAEAQGLGAAALAETKAQAQLLTAAQQAGIPITQKVIDQNQDLAQDAGDAADALAKAKVASDISRGSQTALFTPQDLAIANQLKGIYGDDIPAAMASSEAAALKFNATIKDLGTLGQQVNSGFLVDFETQIRNGASAMQALQTAGVSALGKIADKLASMAADKLWSSAFGGSGGGLLGLFGLGSTAPNTTAINASNATLAGGTGGAFYGPGFASGTDSAPGGMALVGEHGPEILNIPKGAQVIPNDVLRNGGGGGTTVHTGTSINIQGSADQTTLILMQQALAKRDAELPARVVSAVTLAQKQRKLK